MANVTQIPELADLLVGNLEGLLVQSGLSLGEKRGLLECIVIAKNISEVALNDNARPAAGPKIVRSLTKASQNVLGEPGVPHRDPSSSFDFDSESDPRTDADRASGGRYGDDPSDDR